MATERRRSRELALQFEFQREFDSALDQNTRLSNFRKSFDEPKGIWDYAIQIIEGVENNSEKIDALLNSTSSNWSVGRMALVDRNILRIASFEIHFTDTPKKVAINEALEIAKKYGTTESTAFINGILDEIIKLSSK